MIAAPVDFGGHRMAAVMPLSGLGKAALILRRSDAWGRSAMARRERWEHPSFRTVWIIALEDLLLAKLERSEELRAHWLGRGQAGRAGRGRRRHDPHHHHARIRHARQRDGPDRAGAGGRTVRTAYTRNATNDVTKMELADGTSSEVVTDLIYDLSVLILCES